MELSAELESRRLSALRRLKVLNTPREKSFDDIVLLASHLLEAPVALVSLIADDYQWFKACVGVDISQTPRDISFCTHAIAQKNLDHVLVIPDATLDDRFKNNPVVTGPPYVRMYSGAPLVTSEGLAIGTLCVIDSKPRQPTEAQLQALKVLARSVVTQMELRRSAEELRDSEERHRLIIDTALDAVITIDAQRCVTAWNQQAESVLGWTAAEAMGQVIDQLIVPAELRGQGVANFLAGGRATAARDRIETLMLRRDRSVFTAEISIAPLKTSDGWMCSAFIRDISQRRREEEQLRESETRDVAIFALAKLAESRDPETGAHLERVQSYCRALAEQLAAIGQHKEIDSEYIRLLYSTSPLHDIGKVGIPDGVLLKPGRLSDREFQIMKMHTTIGAQTLEAALARFPETKFLGMARDIALTHHERFDGTGYPHGLKGTQIPLCGRIVAVADVYDALSSKRVYKDAFAHDIARGIMLGESGSHFDPAVIAAFMACEDVFTTIRSYFSQSQLIAA